MREYYLYTTAECLKQDLCVFGCLRWAFKAVHVNEHGCDCVQDSTVLWACQDLIHCIQGLNLPLCLRQREATEGCVVLIVYLVSASAQWGGND